MYCENVESYYIMPDEKILDEKIMLWTLKELYLSPYKVYLNNLKLEKFRLNYFKAKKYITQKENYRLEEIINYFIVCLHEELEK